MTAINIFLQPERGIVLTDSLFINVKTGEPALFLDKCVPAPGTNMAVAARGDYRVPQGIAADLGLLYGNIDQVIEDEGNAVRDLYDNWLHCHDEVYFAPVQIMIVGWSPDRDRARGVLVVLAEEWSFEEIDPADGMAAPLPDNRELDRLRQLGVEPGKDWDLETFDPETHGIPFMEAQRRLRLPLPTGSRDKTHIVGGHILFTEVTANGVAQRVIHEWPDTLDEPIRPDAFMPLARTMPAGLSRQQRRAWERVHGKVAA